jgi:phosphoglycerate dehydrogenase-like enzyme
VINQNALLTALQEKKIAGAALDVFTEEPLPANSAFWRLSNVILTPHISAASPFYDQRAYDLVAENIKRYLTGDPLFNQYQPELGY